MFNINNDPLLGVSLHYQRAESDAFFAPYGCERLRQRCIVQWQEHRCESAAGEPECRGNILFS